MLKIGSVFKDTLTMFKIVDLNNCDYIINYFKDNGSSPWTIGRLYVNNNIKEGIWKIISIPPKQKCFLCKRIC